MPVLIGVIGMRVRCRCPALPSTRCAGHAGARPDIEVSMPGWLSLLCGVVVLIAAAYLLYAVLRPESF